MAQGGVIVFEANNADFKNRKRAARACNSCQKRKKRCHHTFLKNSDQQAEKDTAEKVLPQLIHKEPVKFVGDTNPESVLTDLTQRSKNSPRYSRVGVWVEQSRLEQDQFRRQHEAALRNGQIPDADASTKKIAAAQRYAKIERGRRTLTGHQKNYLQAVGALRVLPKSTQDILVTTYVACVEPLLPIVDCKKLLSEYATGEASVFLIQAICLVACKTTEARPYLRLHEDGPLMEPIPFARAIHTGLDAAMKADLEADRFTKVQIMTLMSLHNDGPGGIEESSLHLTMAIHDAQTTGLHINTPGRTRNDQAAMLWWTLWTLDKFNACLGGRPLMIADRDIDIERPLLENNSRSHAMAVWLAMGDLLDEVIEYYRPKIDPETAGWEGEFPSFEDLTKNCSLDVLGDSQKNLLEVCYNIIGILSCRAGGPASRSYNRRIESADRIQKLTEGGKQAQLPPLTLVPYAVALSLTVAYRGLRDSYCDPIKSQADLAARCEILEEMQKAYWTADAMLKLGRKALKSLQQAPSSDGGEQRKSVAGLNIADAMAAEVTACKYGPFNNTEESQNGGQPTPAVSAATVNGTKPHSRSVPSTSNSASDRLQVLSQAAAQMGEPKRRAPTQLTSLNSDDSSTINPRNTRVTSHPNKRPRYNSDNSPLPAMLRQDDSFSPQNTPLLGDTPPTLSTLTNTPVLTPLANPPGNGGLLMNSHKSNSNGDFIINPMIDPFSATNDMDSDVPTSLQMSAPPNNSLAAALGTQPQQQSMYNPRHSVPLHYTNSYIPQGQNQRNVMDINMYNTNDLDNLFDGFFDLSMPTMFEDPVFEAAAYDTFNFNLPTGSGGSGAGSVDMTYGQNNTNNNGQMGGISSSAGRWQSRQGTGNMINEVNQYGNMNMNMNRLSTGGRNNMGMDIDMGMDVTMNSMNSMNQISPEGGANHWCWNEDDF